MVRHIFSFIRDIFILSESERTNNVPRVIDKTVHYKEELGVLYIDKVLVGSEYTEILSQDIERYKFFSYPEYEELLLPFYRAIFHKDYTFEEGFVLTNIPMHWSRYFSRGFDHTYRLAKLLSKEYDIKYQELTIRSRYTKHQFSLGREKRFANIANSFSMKGASPSLLPKKIILIDDIISSGATANAMAQLLKENGIQEIRGYFIASGK